MRGHPFPDVPKLLRGMALRGWSVEDLARASGISLSVAYRTTQGRSVSLETSERISRALLEHPPDTATAAFVLEGGT